MDTLQPIAGVYAAAITPRHEKGHEADPGALLELVDFLTTGGADGIALLGSTGEFVHLSSSDRIRLVDLAVKRSRVPILAGVSHSTLDGAVELAREAARAGVAGVLVMPPYFFRYGPEEVREFYLQFAAAMNGAAPIFLYNIPFFTNEIPIAIAVELLATGLFAGIKDSSGQYEYFDRLQSVSEHRPFTSLVGNDRIFTRARRAGAHGIVSGIACAAPELLVALDRAIQKNLTEQVSRLDALLQEFIAWHDVFPTPVAVKVATGERGLKVGPLATPLGAAGLKRLEEFREWFRGWMARVQEEAVAQ